MCCSVCAIIWSYVFETFRFPLAVWQADDQADPLQGKLQFSAAVPAATKAKPPAKTAPKQS